MGGPKDILYGVWRGIVDSLRGFVLILRLGSERERHAAPTEARADHSSHTRGPSRAVQERAPPVRQRLLECCALNGGVLLLSLLMFQHVLLPALQLIVRLLFGSAAARHDTFSVWVVLSTVLTYTFGALWVLPIFLISKIINCIWFQDIADGACRPEQRTGAGRLSLSLLVADTLFSVFAQALFLIQGMLSGLVLPIYGLGDIACLLHMCLLYSLYAFEYKWFNMGWELHKRLAFIEEQWPYFLGFGLPLALMTQAFSSYIMNGCVFSLVFPVFIISGNEAEPLVGLCDFRLQLFTPVIMVSNALFRRSVSGAQGGAAAQQRRAAVSRSAPAPAHRATRQLR